jgi:selenocysteine insertion sequence-binding protein 2
MPSSSSITTHISYADDQATGSAAHQINGILIGGSQVLVTTLNESPHFKEHSGAVEVLLDNVLNDNDFEDEDCLNESLVDISNVARRFGVIGQIYADTTGDNKGRVHIEYLEGEKAAQHAAQGLAGMIIGGSVVSANISSLVKPSEPTDFDQGSSQTQHVPPPIYSGDKIIPERFAECKRVPKIPNSGPRSYAVKIDDDRAVPLLIEMLGELMRLQERSKDDKNARSRRRLVMGLREVSPSNTGKMYKSLIAPH